MFDKLVYISDKEDVEELKKKFGVINYNTPPANFKEVDAEWVAKQSTFRTYGFKYHWYQQIFIDTDKQSTIRCQQLKGMHFFGSHDGTGFAMYTDAWTGRIRYFSFAGCIHEYRKLTEKEYIEHKISRGMHDHSGICKKCGYIYYYNSSG